MDGADKGRSPKPATARHGARWSKPPGPISTQRGSPRFNRPAPKRAAQSHHRYRLESTTATVRALPQTRRTRGEPQQAGDSHRSRALGLCLGYRSADSTLRRELTTPATIDNSKRGELRPKPNLRLDRRRGALAVRRILDGVNGSANPDTPEPRAR